MSPRNRKQREAIHKNQNQQNAEREGPENDGAATTDCVREQHPGCREVVPRKDIQGGDQTTVREKPQDTCSQFHFLLYEPSPFGSIPVSPVLITALLVRTQGRQWAGFHFCGLAVRGASYN